MHYNRLLIPARKRGDATGLHTDLTLPQVDLLNLSYFSHALFPNNDALIMVALRLDRDTARRVAV